MIKGLFLKTINKYIMKYLENVDENEIEISILKREITLRNCNVNKSSLESFFHLAAEKAKIEKIFIKYSWKLKSMYTISLDNLVLKFRYKEELDFSDSLGKIEKNNFLLEENVELVLRNLYLELSDTFTVTIDYIEYTNDTFDGKRNFHASNIAFSYKNFVFLKIPNIISKNLNFATFIEKLYINVANEYILDMFTEGFCLFNILIDSYAHKFNFYVNKYKNDKDLHKSRSEILEKIRETYLSDQPFNKTQDDKGTSCNLDLGSDSFIDKFFLSISSINIIFEDVAYTCEVKRFVLEKKKLSISEIFLYVNRLGALTYAFTRRKHVGTEKIGFQNKLETGYKRIRFKKKRKAVFKIICFKTGYSCKFLYLESPLQLYKDLGVYTRTIVDLRDIYDLFSKDNRKNLFMNIILENIFIKFDENIRIRSKDFVISFEDNKTSIYCNSNFLFNRFYKTDIFKFRLDSKNNQIFVIMNGLYLDLGRMFLHPRCLNTFEIPKPRIVYNKTLNIEICKKYYAKILDFCDRYSLVCDISDTAVYNLDLSYMTEISSAMEVKGYLHFSCHSILFKHSSMECKLFFENSENVSDNEVSFSNQSKTRFKVNLNPDSISVSKAYCTFKDYSVKIRDCNLYKILNFENDLSFSLRSAKFFSCKDSFLLSDIELKNRILKIGTAQLTSDRSLNSIEQVLYDTFKFLHFENSSKSSNIVILVESVFINLQEYSFSFNKCKFSKDKINGRIRLSDKNIGTRNLLDVSLKDLKTKKNTFCIKVYIKGRACMLFLENLYRTFMNILKKYSGISRSSVVSDPKKVKFNCKFKLDFNLLKDHELFYELKSKGKITYDFKNKHTVFENDLNSKLNDLQTMSITTRTPVERSKVRTFTEDFSKLCIRIRYFIFENTFISRISNINFDINIASQGKILVSGDVERCDINFNYIKFKFLYDKYVSDEGDFDLNIIFKAKNIVLYHEKMIIYEMENFNLFLKDYLSIKYNDVELKKSQIKELDFLEISNLILDYKLIQRAFNFETKDKSDFDVYKIFITHKYNHFLFRGYVVTLYNCVFKYNNLVVKLDYLSYKNNSLKILLESYINNDYIVDETLLDIEYRNNYFILKSNISVNISNRILNNLLESDLEKNEHYRNNYHDLDVKNFTLLPLIYYTKDTKIADNALLYEKKRGILYINNQVINTRNLNLINFFSINSIVYVVEVKNRSIKVYNTIIIVNNTNFSFDFIAQNEIVSVSSLNQLPKIIKVDNFLKYKKNFEFNVIRYKDCDLGIEITKKSDKIYDIYIITIYTFSVIEYKFRDDAFMKNIKFSRNKNKLVNVLSLDHNEFFRYKNNYEEGKNSQQNIFKKQYYKKDIEDCKKNSNEIYIDRVYSKYSPEDICMESNGKCYTFNDKIEKIRVDGCNLQVRKVKNVYLEILDYSLSYSKMNYFIVDYFYSVTNLCDQDIYIGDVCIKSNSCRNLISSLSEKLKICGLETSIPKKNSIVVLNEDDVNGYKEIDVLKICNKRNKVFNLIFEYKNNDLFVRYENVFVNNTEYNILVATDNKGVMILPNSSSYLHHYATTKNFQFSLPYESDYTIEVPYSGYRKKCFRVSSKDSLISENNLIFSVFRSVDGFQKKFIFQREIEAPYRIINNTDYNISFNQKNVDTVHYIDKKYSYVLDNCSFDPFIEVKIQEDTIDVDLEDVYISKGKKFSAIVKQEYNYKLIEILSNDCLIATATETSKKYTNQKISFLCTFKRINLNFFDDKNNEISSLHISEVEIASTYFFDRMLNIYDNNTQLSVGTIQMDNQSSNVKYPVMFYSTNVDRENFLHINFKYFLNRNMLTIREFSSNIGNFEINLEEDVCTEIYKIFELNCIADNKKELNKKRILRITENLYKKNSKNFIYSDRENEDLNRNPYEVDSTMTDIDFRSPFYLKVINSSFSRLSFKANLLKKKSKNFTNSLFNYFINNISDFEINVDELRIDKLEGALQEMSYVIVHFYKSQIYKNLYKFINHLDFLGNIGGFSKSVSLGFKDLTSSKDISSTGLHIVKGTKSILKNTVYGISNSIGKISKSVGSSANLLTFDKSFTESFEYNPYIADIYLHIPIKKNDNKSVELFVKGTEKLVESFYSGFVGIAKKPVKGSSDGLKGVVLGFGKGVIGAVSKPVVGLSEFVTNFTEIIKTSLNSKSRFRIRYPIPRMESIIKYDIGLAESFYLFCHFIKTLPDEYFIDGSKGFYDMECILILTNRRLLLTSLNNIIDINISDINVNSRNKKSFSIGEIIIYVDRPSFIDSLCNFILNVNF